LFTGEDEASSLLQPVFPENARERERDRFVLEREKRKENEIKPVDLAYILSRSVQFIPESFQLDQTGPISLPPVLFFALRPIFLLVVLFY